LNYSILGVVVKSPISAKNFMLMMTLISSLWWKIRHTLVMFKVFATPFLQTISQLRRHWGGARGPGSFVDKLPPALGRLHGKSYYLSFVYALHTLLEHTSYSTRTTTKRTNFSRRFDKPDLNFQKVYTQSKSLIIRSYSEIIIHVHQNCFKLYFSTLQETCQIQLKTTAKLQNRI